MGSTQERRDAYNGLSESQKTAARDNVRNIINGVLPQRPQSRNVTLSLVDGLGINVETSSLASPDIPTTFFNKQKVSGRGLTDLDRDGLTEAFEGTLADGFTPYYFVSGGELSGTGFSRFNDSVPQTVSQTFGPTPPISHYRVKPLGHFTRNSDGLQYGLIQIDYLTLWNRDDGPLTGGACVAGPILDNSPLFAHPIDNERSAVMVAAPLVNGSYDANAASYKLFEVYTAGHENTFFDTSMRFNISAPFPFGSHVKLALSKSKHATYVFNPDYYPLTPVWAMVGAYSAVSLLYANGTISFYEYLTYLFLLDQAFFECQVERFQIQSGVYAGTRINVGEIHQPINSSAFILSDELAGKLEFLFY